jgi:hypothetical protein
MKRIKNRSHLIWSIVCTSIFLAFGIAQAADSATPNEIEINGMMGALLEIPAPGIPIDWKVGDQMSYNLSVNGWGNIGTSTKIALREEGEALWVRQTAEFLFQKEVIEVLLSRKDGKVLKALRNGKPQDGDDLAYEIISQDEQDVTIGLGTFHATHIIAKTKQAPRVEIWAAPSATVMDGTVKQIMETQYGTILLELNSFKK